MRWFSAKKISKSNGKRIFGQSRQGRWISFVDLDVEQVFPYVENLPSWNTTCFTYSLIYIIAISIYCHFFFSCFTAIIQLSVDFTTLERLFSCLVFRKEFRTFLFLSDMSEKQESTLSERLKFTDSIYRVLSGKKAFFVDKAIQFNRFFVLRQMSL